MTPEEQQAMVQFMGTVHAQAKQQDQMIVGQSQYVKPISNDVKAALEASLSRPPSHPAASPHHATPPPLPPQSSVVTPEQAQQELMQAQQEQVITPGPVQMVADQINDPNQMEFDLSEQTKLDKIVELLEKQNRLLVELKDNYAKNIKSCRKKQAE